MGVRLSPRRWVCHDLHVEQPDHIETTSWLAMLGKDEREVSDEEIVALGGRARANSGHRWRGVGKSKQRPRVESRQFAGAAAATI